MTKDNLFDLLKKANSVVAIEQAFDKFDAELTAGARADLLLKCSGLTYYDFDGMDMEDSDRYVNEVTSFLSKQINHEELYRKFI